MRRDIPITPTSERLSALSLGSAPRLVLAEPMTPPSVVSLDAGLGRSTHPPQRVTASILPTTNRAFAAQLEALEQTATPSPLSDTSEAEPATFPLATTTPLQLPRHAPSSEQESANIAMGALPLPLSSSAFAVSSTGAHGHALTTGTEIEHVESLASGSSSTAVLSSTHLRYDALLLRSTVTVPIFHHDVRLSLGSSYDRTESATTTLPYYPYHDASAAAAGVNIGSTLQESTPTTLIGKSTTSARYSYGAGAAIRLPHHLALGIGYARENLTAPLASETGPTVASGSDRTDLYTGSLTYAPHGGKSSITLIGRASRDLGNTSIAPAPLQTRGDILFSVKF